MGKGRIAKIVKFLLRLAKWATLQGFAPVSPEAKRMRGNARAAAAAHD
ncbi:MAG: hypothetical protein KJ549_05225 [Alphaproteobacteria bacterium]|nr:hypothetical protein [Alphaproteobacteria bacterium]